MGVTALLGERHVVDACLRVRAGLGARPRLPRRAPRPRQAFLLEGGAGVTSAPRFEEETDVGPCAIPRLLLVAEEVA